MLKWTYLAAAAGWAASMVYEWMWDADGSGGYFAWGVIGVTVLGGLFIRGLARQGARKDPSPMIWFLLAALAAALFYSALERTAKGSLTHIPMLPMYLVLFVDFFTSGCYTWWKKLKKNRRN